MGNQKVRIILDITVRDYTKKERDEESLEKEECAGAAEDFVADDLAVSIADYVLHEQDEILAGSDCFVKIKNVEWKIGDPTPSKEPDNG